MFTCGTSVLSWFSQTKVEGSGFVWGQHFLFKQRKATTKPANRVQQESRVQCYWFTRSFDLWPTGLAKRKQTNLLVQRQRSSCMSCIWQTDCVLFYIHHAVGCGYSWGCCDWTDWCPFCCLLKRAQEAQEAGFNHLETGRRWVFRHLMWGAGLMWTDLQVNTSSHHVNRPSAPPPPATYTKKSVAC